MPRDVRTNVVVQGEAKGLDKVLQQVLGINQKASRGLIEQAKAYKTVQKEISGYQKQLQELSKRQLALSKDMAQIKDKAAPAYKSLQDSLHKVNQEARDTERVIRNLERAFSAQADAATKVSRAQAQMGREQRQAQQQSRWAFTQGFLQTAMPGAAPLFFQRGPGMGRQFAGQMVGGLFRRARGVAGGLAQAPFTGVQGLAQALSVLPGGQVLAGQLMNAAAYAEQAVQYQQVRRELIPYIGGRQNIDRVRYLRGREADRRKTVQNADVLNRKMELAVLDQRFQQNEISREAYERQRWMLTEGPQSYYGASGAVLPGMEAQRKKWEETVPEKLRAVTGEEKPTFDILGYWGEKIVGTKSERQTKRAKKTQEYIRRQLMKDPTFKKMMQEEGYVPGSAELRHMAGGGFSNLQQKAHDTRMDIERHGMDRREKFQKAELAQRRKAGSEIWRLVEGVFQSPAQLGMKYRGISKQEAIQEVGQIMQAGGGIFGAGDFAQRFRQREFMATAMAARTAFGVQPEVAGAFLKAGRRGGLVGARGFEAEALTSTLSDALKLGLEGSEINTYLQQVAAGIQRWEQTGIPFNKDSIQSMGLEFSKAGITATRAVGIAGGMQQYLQGMGTRGIQTGLDYLMLQRVGGFRGGGAGGTIDALLQLEQLRGGDFTGAKAGTAIGDVLGELVKMGGGGKQGAYFMQQLLQRRGIQMGVGEAMLLGERVTGTEFLTQEQRERFSVQEETERFRGEREAAKLSGPKGLQRLAEGLVSPTLRAQAGLQNKQLEIGNKAVGSVTKLSIAAANTAGAFSELAKAGGPLDRFSTSMVSITKKLEDLAKSGKFNLTEIFKMIIT